MTGGNSYHLLESGPPLCRVGRDPDPHMSPQPCPDCGLPGSSLAVSVLLGHLSQSLTHSYTQQPKPAGHQPLWQKRMLCPCCLLSTLEGLSQLALGRALQRQPETVLGALLRDSGDPALPSACHMGCSEGH